MRLGPPRPLAALDEAHAFVRLDAVASADVLKGPALRGRGRRIAHRIRTIDSPAYAHDKGRVPTREEWEAAEAGSTSASRP